MAKNFRNKTFQRVIRGYAPEEVNDYLAYVNEEYRKLERRNSDNERKLEVALAKLDEISNAYMELINDGDARGDIYASDRDGKHIARDEEKYAKLRANQITSEAAVTASHILQAAKEEAEGNKKKAEEMYRAANAMYSEICSFRDEMFGLYNDHIESIEAMVGTAERYMNGIEEFTPEEINVDTIVSDEEVEDGEELYVAEPYDNTDDNLEEQDWPDDELKEFEEVEEFGVVDEEDISDVYESDLGDTIAMTDEVADDAELYYDETDAESEAFDDGNVDDFEQVVNDYIVDLPEDEADTEDVAYDEAELLDFEFVEDEAEDDTSDVQDDISEMFKIDWRSHTVIENNTETVPLEENDSVDTSEWMFEDELEDDFVLLNDEFEADGTMLADESVGFEEYVNIDDSFEDENTEDEMSFTDEFDIVFASSSSEKNVEEIRRQPIIESSEPSNPKKHQKL